MEGGVSRRNRVAVDAWDAPTFGVPVGHTPRDVPMSLPLLLFSQNLIMGTFHFMTHHLFDKILNHPKRQIFYFTIMEHILGWVAQWTVQIHGLESNIVYLFRDTPSWLVFAIDEWWEVSLMVVFASFIVAWNLGCSIKWWVSLSLQLIFWCSDRYRHPHPPLILNFYYHSIASLTITPSIIISVCVPTLLSFQKTHVKYSLHTVSTCHHFLVYFSVKLSIYGYNNGNKRIQFVFFYKCGFMSHVWRQPGGYMLGY